VLDTPDGSMAAKLSAAGGAGDEQIVFPLLRSQTRPCYFCGHSETEV
jgi:hypothetical protein